MSLTVSAESNQQVYKAPRAPQNKKTSNISVYDQQLLDEHEAYLEKRRTEKIKAGEKAIENANAYGYEEFGLTMETDRNGKKTGMVVIAINEKIEAKELRNMLGIPSNKLYEHNKAAFEKFGSARIGDTGVETYEYTDIPKGVKLYIPGTDVNVKKPFMKSVVDFFTK